MNPLFLWNMTCGTCFEWTAEQCGTHTGWELIYITSFQQSESIIKANGFRIKWNDEFHWPSFILLHQLRYVLRRFRVSIFCIISWNLPNTLPYSEEKLKDQQKLTQANAHKMVFFQLISVLWKQPNQNQRDYMARDHSPAWSVSSTVRNFLYLYFVFSIFNRSKNFVFVFWL